MGQHAKVICYCGTCKKCKNRISHRTSYNSNPVGKRQLARDYYWANRSTILAKRSRCSKVDEDSSALQWLQQRGFN